MRLLVLCPSRGRPDAARRLLKSFRATHHDRETRLVFVVDRDDPRRREYPGEVYIAKPTGSYAGALNAAARESSVVRDATAVGFVGDDCEFRTPGWDVKIGGWLTDNIGIAWPDDGWDHPWRKEDKASHWFISRPIVDAFGMVPPDLRHFFTDDYWAQLGWAAGCARYFDDVLIEHLHPMAGKGIEDEVYKRASRHAGHDRRWFREWQETGKLRDVARLRALLGPRDERRRILADWHHPALWESLSILFEDRLGWELYSPLGIDWTRFGWEFRHAGWQPEDYLIHPNARDVGDHFTIPVPEYPARPRKAVTWQQANAMQWDFVLASVSVHQRGFSEIAARFGARFIHQVGNAKHPIDRRIPQIILASAVLERGHRHPVLRWNQPFDRNLFARTPIANRFRVQSLMLRLASTSCDYSWVGQAPCLEWRAVEAHDMRAPGYVAPMAKVAAMMRDAGWIWHDKKVGDGYGHVMFTAAAMGRPLIGHARHFRGMAGAPLWDDLRTCIDLDRHTPDEAARLIRAIARDEDWQDEMAANIAAKFDALVDFDAETEAIRAALA